MLKFCVENVKDANIIKIIQFDSLTVKKPVIIQ